MLVTYNFEGVLYEFTRACCNAGQRAGIFFRAKSVLSELKAFSASIKSMASASAFSNSFLKLWIAYLILAYVELGLFFEIFKF